MFRFSMTEIEDFDSFNADRFGHATRRCTFSAPPIRDLVNGYITDTSTKGDKDD
jgi:hypothetical protein